MNYYSLFWIVNAAAALLRLSIIGFIGLSGDEAHYWTYTQYPELSYFDHPPFVAWVIKFFTLIFGNNEFGVRFPAVAAFFVLCWIIYLWTKDAFDEKTAFWTVVLLNVTPVFSFVGSVLTIPDTPLSVFWMLYVYLFWKLTRNQKGYLWYALGALLGLGLLSKYNAVLMAVSAAFYLALSKDNRHWFRRFEPYAALAIAGIVFLPVIIWNLQNNFASFGFQLRHGFGNAAPHFSLALLGKCLGAQAGYVSPLLFLTFWASLYYAGKKYLKEKSDAFLFILSFSFPTLFLFNFIASFNEILPHWPAMGYLILAAAVTDLTIKSWNRAWFRYFTYVSWAIGLIITVLIPLQAIFKVLPPEAFLPKDEARRIEDGITRAEKIDVTNELYGWHEVGNKLDGLLAAPGEKRPFIFTHRHYISSQLSFYTPKHPRIYTLSDRADAYDFWQRDLSDLDGRDALFVTNDYFYAEPQQLFPCKKWEKLEPIEIYRNGRKVRIFWIWRGTSFSLNDLPPECTSNLVGHKTTSMAGIRKADYKVFWLINRDFHSDIVDFFMWKFTELDTRINVNTMLVIVIVAVGFVLWHAKREKFYAELILLIGIVSVGGIIIHVLKDTFDRWRPLLIFGDSVRVFHEKLTLGSFPSGHTQIAFGVATYLASRFKRYWWAYYLMALMAGLSRVYIGVHFPVDVVGGAIIGSGVAWLMTKYIKI
ncbi:MAG: glycosyltransferase family 39 protein [Endomicrobiales bacterium]|nr:glycosyltransferase family 39 protein [Endomicrobiales bacterium]